MGETPIQYTRRPDDRTLKEWRRRSRRSENVFAGLIDDGTDAANEQARATLRQGITKVQKGVAAVATVRAMEDSLRGNQPAENAAFKLARPPTREFEKLARARGRSTGFREGPGAEHFVGRAFDEHAATAQAPPPAAAATAQEALPSPQPRRQRPTAAPLVPVELEDSLASRLASQDVRRKPLVAGNQYGNYQLGLPLELALQNCARSAAARKKAAESRATSAIDTMMEESGWGEEWAELLAASGQARDMEGALRSSLLDLMGSSQRVAPGAGGGWGLPSVDAFRNIPVMTPDGKHRESSWALHGRRGSPSPQRRKGSPEKWESPFARHHPAARRR